MPLNIPTVLQPVVIADVDTAASSLVVTGTSSDTNVLPNANIVIGTLGLSRTLSVHPLQTGTATVTVRVSDGVAQSAQSFLLTVTNLVTPNIPPTLASLANLTINEDAGAQTVLLTGISSGGESQTLTVTASATPQSLIPSIETVYVSPRTTGTVSFVTAPNSWGTGVVNVTVSDGLAQTVRSFTVTVNPANDAPTLTSIANSTTIEDTATPPDRVHDRRCGDTASSLTLSGTSSNLTLVPQGNIVFGGSGANRTVQVTPATGQLGTAMITVWVSDGALAGNRAFELTVVGNEQPTDHGAAGKRERAGENAIRVVAGRDRRCRQHQSRCDWKIIEHERAPGRKHFHWDQRPQPNAFSTSAEGGHDDCDFDCQRWIRAEFTVIPADGDEQVQTSAIGSGDEQHRRIHDCVGKLAG